MKRRQQQRSNLRIELLEARQLMAADLMPTPAPLEILPDDNTQPAIVSDLAAASRPAPRPSGIVIPSGRGGAALL